MATDVAAGDEIFLRLRRRIYEEVDRWAAGASDGIEDRTVLKETGRLAPRRPYFYLKPLNEQGWLFERSGAGWVVSRSEKIVGQNLFLRRGEPWDIVSVFLPESAGGGARIASGRFGSELVGFAIYEHKLLDALGFGAP